MVKYSERRTNSLTTKSECEESRCRWVKCLSVTITSNFVVSPKLSQHRDKIEKWRWTDNWLESGAAVEKLQDVEDGRILNFITAPNICQFFREFQKLAFAKNNLKIFNATICFWSRCGAETSILFSKFKLEIDLTQFPPFQLMLSYPIIGCVRRWI